ncbi:hypothetical protein KL930_000166 [Ogataea haglerorum]|nr:uncharacterized protein KL911_000966 [Ogataea haglerorum]KAG7697779.1 hypothetical protein KL951_002353 [Ogataea haglerorum]KAG7701381.1 hypothetical protein KL915_000412 [Ogataea haglerorum]KAG7706600.1 hypothetical protein KL950_003265 [Ogataea haglerorum]KAG7709339.1 hypothetical protein KL914_001729 [Ogataea haglerorum]KAG7717798.1 hypothetical protein KL913_002734 [Ogataea haglerorum]
MLSFLILITLVFLVNKILSTNTASATGPNTAHKMKVIQSADEFKQATSVSNLVVIDFFATWCGPCKMIAPMLEKFSAEYSSFDFYKVDVDELPEIASQYDVTSMPTILFLKDGKEVKRIIGANPSAIKAFLASQA